MMSVTKRISAVTQPNKGYLPISMFSRQQYSDSNTIIDTDPNWAPIQGLAVDYLTRFLLGVSIEDAFNISLLGAFLLDLSKNTSIEQEKAQELLDGIKGLDDISIKNACKLVFYDDVYRAGPDHFHGTDHIQPSPAEIDNIRILVNRTLKYFRSIGPIVLSGFSFDGGYTELVSTGDGDYLTNDMLIDLKVSKYQPKSDWTLQLLMYYLLGIHSEHEEFSNIKTLCIFNPLLNASFIIHISEISDWTMYMVSRDVLGYKMRTETSLSHPDYSTWRDVEGSAPTIVNSVMNENNWYRFNMKEYEDGIHSLSIKDYWSYLKTNYPSRYDLKPSFKNITKVLLLKRAGYTMFLSISANGGIGILRGAGLTKTLHSPDFYFDNLIEYANRSMSIVSEYYDVLYNVSELIYHSFPDDISQHQIDNIRINSSITFEEYLKNKAHSRVHGCIIDVDFYNHVFFCPLSNNIFAYHSFSAKNTRFYPTIDSLIRIEALKPAESIDEDEIRRSFIISDQCKNNIASFLNKLNRCDISKNCSYITISNQLGSLQSIYESKHIQVWYEEIMDDSKYIPPVINRENVRIWDLLS